MYSIVVVVTYSIMKIIPGADNHYLFYKHKMIVFWLQSLP